MPLQPPHTATHIMASQRSRDQARVPEQNGLVKAARYEHVLLEAMVLHATDAHCVVLLVRKDRHAAVRSQIPPTETSVVTSRIEDICLQRLLLLEERKAAHFTEDYTAHIVIGSGCTLKQVVQAANLCAVQVRSKDNPMPDY